MALTIKEAADNLLSRGDITQAEYDSIGLEKLSEFNPDFLKKVLSDNKLKKKFVKFVSKEPRSDAFNETMKDKAFADQFGENLMNESFSDKIKGMAQHWWIPVAGIGATVAAKEGLVDPIAQAVKMHQSYSNLANKTPQLQEVDQNKIRDYFEIVKTYSPHAAANPLVAGAIINKMVEFGGVDHKLVQDLMNIQKGIPSNDAVKTMVGSGIGSFSKMPSE